MIKVSYPFVEKIKLYHIGLLLSEVALKTVTPLSITIKCMHLTREFRLDVKLKTNAFISLE